MKVQIGDKYVDKDGGIIRTVTKVFVAEEGNSEYIVFDTNENYALPLCQVNRLCTKIVQSEPNPDPFAAVRAAYPEAKWISKDKYRVGIHVAIHVYFEKPRLDKRGMWGESDWDYLSPEDFPEVYAHFAGIPWNESLTAI